MTIILIGALIAILGGLIGAIGTWRHNKNSSEKSTRIEFGVNKGLDISKATNDKVQELGKQNTDLKNKATELQNQIENQSSTIDLLRRENTELYSKLSRASLEIFNNITGGDSFCKMEITNTDPSGEIGNIIFLIEGKYPLSGIQARIVDLNEPLNKENITKNVVNVGTLQPNKTLYQPNLVLQLNKKMGVNLNIFFGANNGFTTQLIRKRFVNGAWVSAIKVQHEPDGKELFIKIDAEYPTQDKIEIFKN